MYPPPNERTEFDIREFLHRIDNEEHLKALSKLQSYRTLNVSTDKERSRRGGVYEQSTPAEEDPRKNKESEQVVIFIRTAREFVRKVRKKKDR